ncbi:hypothetical protein Q4R26_09510 [Morganella morganii]|nr:hypothetical protein [Morganella morganii]UVZ54818.1 hypothetical protein NYO97_04270 [Morganella morganii]WLV38869.1 hypothetical protein M2O45_17720 [Morganella morganii]
MSRPELDARIDALNQLHGAKPKQKTDTKRIRVRSRRQKNKKRG